MNTDASRRIPFSPQIMDKNHHKESKVMINNNRNNTITTFPKMHSCL